MRSHLSEFYKRARGCLGILALCFLSIGLQGCDEMRALGSLEELEPELEQRLREEPARPGKVGQIVALGVRQRALRAAASMATLSDSTGVSCETYAPAEAPQGRYSYKLSIDLVRPGSRLPPLHWEEEVVLERDTDGNVNLSQRVQYSQETGHQGSREHTWRAIGDRVFTSEDGERFARHREPSRVRREAWVMRRANTLQVLVSAVGGWEREEAPQRSGASPARWRAGDAPLRCGASVSADELRWWNRWRRRGSVREANLEVNGDGSRVLTVEWDLGQEAGARVVAHFEDRFIEDKTIQIVAPEPARVLDARTESWGEVDRAIDALVKEGVLELQTPREKEEAEDE